MEALEGLEGNESLTIHHNVIRLAGAHLSSTARLPYGTWFRGIEL